MFKRQRPTDSAASGSNRGSSGAKRRRVVDCVKILFEITKESADWCPALKSVLGGVSVLIKHYEEFADVREKVEELIPLLDRFKHNITTTIADNDPEETTRRRRLTSTFEQIEELSQKLLAKGPITRFADKGEDSKAVATLVERLREAISCYQISQQQAIYHQITHLASSFNAFLMLQEKPPVVGHKLEFVVSRLNRLRDAPWSELQHEWWTKLFDGLRSIRDRAKELCDRIEADGYVEDETDILTASGLAEELQGVLLEYSMVQQQAVHDQNRRLIDTADLSVLNTCRRARGVEFRHGNRRVCLKGTRETVLGEIGSWAQDFDRSPVFWLNGLAGTGKTTIAQTAAERLFIEERLGASFFCSRDFEDRSNLHFIFPTLAFQLAYRYPEFRPHLVSLLKSNPDVAHESLYSQMQKLIVEPLQEIGISTVIVIDALDECKDGEPSSAILSVLGRFVERIPRVKFFITGRPEPRIKTGFRLPLLMDLTDVFVLHGVHPSLVNNDIRLFLKYELSELARRRYLEDGWPSDEHVDLLCRRAAGFFVYAVATVKFLDSNSHLPKYRLGAILELPENTAPEGRTRFNPKTTLDSLYTSILQAAFSEEDPDSDARVRSTIGAIVLLVNPLPLQAIAKLVGLDREEVALFLTSIQSLLTVDEDSNSPVKPFHKSFPDFITDPSRCKDRRFHIVPGHLHFELVTNCLGVMNKELKEGILSLPEYALNSEVRDLQARVDRRVSVALQYACRSWHNHLTGTTAGFAGVVPYLRVFLEVKFLEWLEVLSVVGDVGGAVVALEKLMSWLQEVVKDNGLLATAKDCFYFVTKFFEPIKASAAHIYHSALEMCPMSSLVRKRYYHKYRRANRLPRVMVGISDSWDPTISISSKEDDYDSCTWSPCGRFVAAQTRAAVEIRNQLTFELLTILEPTGTTLRLTGPLAYSPDGRSLACASDTAIVIWDIQTGGVAKEIKHGTDTVTMAWSLDGRTICFIVSQETPSMHTYDVRSGKTVSFGSLQPGHSLYLWAYGESFRITTVRTSVDSAFIDTFEVGSPLTKVYSFCTPFSGSMSTPSISFSPTTCRVSVADGCALRVFHGWTLNSLLEERTHSTTHCFSSDGGLFAASEENSARIWKYDSGRYVLWKRFRIQDWTNSSLQFSPTSSSILRRSGGILQVWRLPDLPTTPNTRRQHFAGLSRSCDRIATAQQLEGTVTIFNLHSRTPSQTIDTGIGIEGLVVTGNVLLVVGSEKVVAWLFTEAGLANGMFGLKPADRSDSIWALSLPQWHSELCTFSVEDQFGVIRFEEEVLLAYNVETGAIPLPAHTPQHTSVPHQRFSEVVCGRDYLRYHELFQQNEPPEGGWQVSRTMLREGWVKDSEGKHRFWVPTEWRKSFECGNWSDDMKAFFGFLESEPLIIKF